MMRPRYWEHHLLPSRMTVSSRIEGELGVQPCYGIWAFQEWSLLAAPNVYSSCSSRRRPGGQRFPSCANIALAAGPALQKSFRRTAMSSLPRSVKGFLRLSTLKRSFILKVKVMAKVWAWMTGPRSHIMRVGQSLSLPFIREHLQIPLWTPKEKIHKILQGTWCLNHLGALGLPRRWHSSMIRVLV